MRAWEERCPLSRSAAIQSLCVIVFCLAPSVRAGGGPTLHAPDNDLAYVDFPGEGGRPPARVVFQCEGALVVRKGSKWMMDGGLYLIGDTWEEKAQQMRDGRAYKPRDVDHDACQITFHGICRRREGGAQPFRYTQTVRVMADGLRVKY